MRAANIVSFALLLNESSMSMEANNTPVAAAAPDLRREPLRIQLNDDEAPVDLADDRRQILERLTQLIETELYYLPGSTCPVPFPDCKLITTSSCENDVPNLVQLFHRPSEQDEVQALSMENGKPRRLTREQVAQVALDGTFDVPSKLYPTQKHTWKLARWMQKGRNQIAETFRRGMGKALYHVLIGIPDRLVNDTFISVRRGLLSVKTAVLGIMDSVVGVVDMVPLYSEDEVTRILQELENDHVYNHLQNQTGSGSDSSLLPGDNEDDAYVEMEIGSKSLHVDARLFDNQLRKKLDPVVKSLSAYALTSWDCPGGNGKARMEIKARLDELGLDKAEYSKRLTRELERRELDVIRKSLDSEPRIEMMAPGYGKSWVNLLHIQLLVKEAEQDREEEIANKREAFMEQVQREHPVRPLVDEWLEQRVNSMLTKLREEMRWSSVSSVAGKAVEDGLGDLAFVYQDLQIPFQKKEAPRLRNELLKARKAASTFTFPRRIWRPSKWIKEKQGREFVAQKYEYDQVTTEHPFWRLSIVMSRVKCNFCNGLYAITRNLWCGPFGMKSLFMSSPFVHRYQMDRSTGDILPDEAHLQQTLRSRLVAIWDHVGKIRREFEALPDTGFLGKSIERALNRLSAYCGIGIPGTVLVLLGQPLLTAVNVVASSILIILTPLWSLLLSLLEYVFCSTIYDSYESGVRTPCTGSWFVLVGHAVGGIAIQGLFRGSLALIAGIIVHPCMACLRFGFETLRRGARTVYDFVMRNVLIRLGRVPGRDSFLAWRIAGPGITSKYCLQVRPDVALLTLAAYLELKEIEIYEEYAREVIQGPLARYRKFFEPFAPLGVYVSTSCESLSFLEGLCERQMKDLNHQVTLARRCHHRIFDVGRAVTEHVPDVGSNVSASRLLVKQSESDSDEMLRRALPLVKSFCDRVTTKYGAKAVEGIWMKADVTIGNLDALTKLYLTNIFQQEFLEPMEVTDDTIVVKVESEQLSDVLERLFQSD